MTSTASFQDKVSFITGAGSGGFGSAFAQALCERGASAAVVDIDGAAAEATAAGLNAQGYRALGIQCDVADEHSVAAAVERTVAELGGVDILINNAGLHSLKYNVPFQKLGIADIRRLFDVNIMGVIQCSLACHPHMARRGGGAIINIASVAAFTNSSPYGVSKLAVRGLTIAQARDFSGDRIRVNAIAPGLMATQAIKDELPGELFAKFTDENQLIHRTGEIKDIVSAMLFLCSDDASFITGETLKVSGGYPLII